MSMPPRCPRAASTSAPTPASVAASPGTGWPPISSATAVAASASRSLTTTRAPSAAIRIAMARPIPCPAPVTTTALPRTSTSDAPGECRAAVDDDDLPGDPVAGTAQRHEGIVERLLPAGGDADLGAVCDQPFGDAEADTPARSGHHGDLAPEPVAHQESLSRIMAMPWPPPTHMVSRPNCLSWNCMELMRVVVILSLIHISEPTRL